MTVRTKQARITGAGFSAIGIAVIVAAEQAGLCAAYLLAVCIVVGIAAKQAGFAATNLLSIGIVMIDGTKQTRLTSTLLYHISILPVVIECLRIHKSIEFFHAVNPFKLSFFFCLAVNDGNTGALCIVLFPARRNISPMLLPQTFLSSSARTAKGKIIKQISIHISLPPS